MENEVENTVGDMQDDNNAININYSCGVVKR